MSSISLKERFERIDRVREEMIRRREEEPYIYSWRHLEEDIGNAAGYPVSRTAIRQFVAGGKPGSDSVWDAYDAWGVREGILEPMPRAEPMMARETQMQDQASLGNQIRTWREKAEMTQGELAAAVGLDQSMISRLERGEIKHPQEEVIERIKKATVGAAYIDLRPPPMIVRSRSAGPITAETTVQSTEYGRQVDRVLEGPGTPEQKVMMIESIGAGYRAVALEQATAASKEEAEKAPHRGAPASVSSLSPEAAREIWGILQRAIESHESDAPPATDPARDQPGG